ncbi:FMN-dependent NADH-azoreductase 2 [Listeria monocytogenes N53-1]|nr:FMN-dependent NADH-azoreductase 2 [Listeria monocytogenes]CCQ23269.1 FMN-dependent NADH-azoreductase 2 [Listeria monocytogenes N53-1]
MSKVLFIKASPLPNEVSRSSQVAETFMAEYKAKNPSDTVEELVLYNTEVPLLDLELMTAGRELQAGKAFTDLAPDVQKKCANGTIFSSRQICFCVPTLEPWNPAIIKSLY